MSDLKSHPPKIALRFFKWFCDQRIHKYLEGDLLELFEQNIQKKGLKRARRGFVWEVLKLFRPGIIKNLEGTRKLNYYGMLKNYFITSIRFILREKSFALMNIAGLALGIASAITIYRMLDYDLSYDKHHANYDRIYRVNNEDITSDGKKLYRSQTHPLAEAIRTDFQSVQAAMTFYDEDGLIGIEDEAGNIQRYQEKVGVAFVEPQFLDLFTIIFLQGDPATALSEPGKVILSRTKAKKYFGVTDQNLHEVIGKSLTIENAKTIFVSAVMEDFPKTSDFPFELLFHYNDQDVTNQWFYEGKSWGEYNSATNCWIMLDEGVSPIEFEKGLASIVVKYLPEYNKEVRTYRLQPLSDLHYSDQLRSTYAGITATKNELLILGLIGLMLIVTACINFINLSTAQAVKRSKEIGVRKTMGSRKSQLVFQFIFETFLITLLATIVGLILAQYMVGAVGGILEYDMSLNLTDLNLIYFVLGLLFLVTFLAGLYPSFVLSKMNPVLAVKNSINVKNGSGFLSLRRMLVILQFAISQILIIGLLILNAQMNYIKSQDLGFNKEAVLTVKLPEFKDIQLDVLKNQLNSHSAIQSVSLHSSGPMAKWNSTNPIFHPNIEGMDQIGSLKTVDEDYFDTFELEMIAGQGFKNSDPRSHVVVNRRLTEVLGFEDPSEALGETVKYGRGSLEFEIVGVVEDFHAASLHSDYQNVFMANVSWNVFQAAIKLNENKTSYAEIKEVIAHIEESWSSHYPENVFEFEFYDDHLATYYKLEESVTQVMKGFVFMAIIIGALGLYGLVAFMANKKTKEIGIRKVMGASEMSIWNIFSKELLTLLMIAFLVSGPVAYFLMRSFLDIYAYRIELGPQFFIIAIVASVGVAILTVGYKSIKVARANPILSLRDE